MLFKSDVSEIQSYLEDTSSIRNGFTDGVFIPETYDDVQATVRKCYETHTRLTLSGNGTGTTGGRIPFGGAVLATNRLNKILNIQKGADGGGTASVQCGVLLFDIQQAADELGLIYTPDPTERYCFIGGTIANNSSGARTFKYGATRPYIQRLKLVLPNGGLLDIRRGDIFADKNGIISFNAQCGQPYHIQVPTYVMPNVSKHVAGYFAQPEMDLIDLFIGSEGTLGVILEADLKLLPKPARIFSGLIYFDSESSLLDFVDEARRLSKTALSLNDLSARALEYFDRNALNFLRAKYPQIPRAAVGAIFFEQETNDEAEDEALQKWFALMAKHLALLDHSWIALSPDEQQAIRDFRHALPVLVNEWYARFKQRKISTDMAVPLSYFPTLMKLYQTACQAEGLDYILFGHIGDAHLHLNILPKNPDEATKAKALYRTFIQAVVCNGGTIAAEHGVGKLKAEYLVEMFGEQGICEMTRIKKSLDERLIMNIGNLIPESYLR